MVKIKGIMVKFALLLCLLSTTFVVKGQNLVPNGDFEAYLSLKFVYLNVMCNPVFAYRTFNLSVSLPIFLSTSARRAEMFIAPRFSAGYVFPQPCSPSPKGEGVRG